MAEGYIKDFISSYKPNCGTETDDNKDNKEIIKYVLALDSIKNFSKEKLLVCCDLMRRKLKQYGHKKYISRK